MCMTVRTFVRIRKRRPGELKPAQVVSDFQTNNERATERENGTAGMGHYVEDALLLINFAGIFSKKKKKKLKL